MDLIFFYLPNGSSDWQTIALVLTNSMVHPNYHRSVVTVMVLLMWLCDDLTVVLSIFPF